MGGGKRKAGYDDDDTQASGKSKFVMNDPSNVPAASPAREESSSNDSLEFISHIRALNTQFFSWVNEQMKENPSEFWIEGVHDYINYVSDIKSKFSKVIDSLQNSATWDSKFKNGKKLSTESPAPTAKSNPFSNIPKPSNFSAPSFGASPPSLSSTPFTNPFTSSNYSISNPNPFLASNVTSAATSHAAASSSFSTLFSASTFSAPTSLFSTTFATSSSSAAAKSSFPSFDTSKIKFGSNNSFNALSSDTATGKKSEDNEDDADEEPEKPGSPSVKKLENSDEKILLESRAKLFVKEKDGGSKAWKDLGVGLLCLKQTIIDKQNEKYDKPFLTFCNDVGKRLLNAFLYANMKVVLNNNNLTLMLFSSVKQENAETEKPESTEAEANAKSSKVEPQMYLIRFGNKKSAEDANSIISSNVPEH